MNRRRKARLNAVEYERVDRDALYERDGGICGICKEPVERKKMTIDHIIPLSKGGPHTWANLQIAHSSCNNHKRARTMEEFLAAQAV